MRNVEISIVLFRDRKRECQRAKGLFRAVIGMQDSAELPERQNRLSAQIRLGDGADKMRWQSPWEIPRSR
jgi:hypothetical protein